MSDNVQCPGQAPLSHQMQVIVHGTCPACQTSAQPPTPAPATPAPARVCVPAGVAVHGPTVYAAAIDTDGIARYTPMSGPGWL